MQSHREEAGQVRAGEQGPRLCRVLSTSGETWEEGADRPPRASLSPGGGGRGGLAMRATREWG